MSTLTIPMGSQHIALLEPLHFRFTTENERVAEVDADVGYVHRGIEKACVTKFKFRQVSYVVGRVCGLCAISHSTIYSQLAEKMVNVQIPRRAAYLRMLAVELDRLHSHMLCLSHTAENTGFEALFMTIMKYRETVMEILELLTGNRVQFDYVSVGGVNRDLTIETANEILCRLKDFRKHVDELMGIFTSNWTLSVRYKGVGAITKDQALKYNAVGPLARAAGLPIDVRQETEDILPWKEVGYEIVTDTTGDVYARNIVRLKEMYVSLQMIENIINGIPEGPINVEFKGFPVGDAVMRLEAPRGELFYFARGNKTQVLERLKIKAPTFSNVAAMVEIFKGQEYASVPPILASLDPCLSCTAR
jgi:ech hydrogenase subunit E